MSHIGDLIHQHCPDGVPHVRLSEIVGKIRTIRWSEYPDSTFKYIDLTSVEPRLHKIVDTRDVTENDAPSRAQQIVQQGDVLFGTTRPMQKRYARVPSSLDGQIASTGYCVLRIEDERIRPEFLLHAVSSTEFYNYIDENQHGASYPSISDKLVKNYMMPVPPLPVQEEIVRILDSFTNLEAELEAELEARRQQYDWYRNRAFSSLQLSNDVVRLGDLGLIARGRRFTKADQAAEGIPAIHYGEIYTRYGTATDSVFTYLRSDLVNSLRFAQPNDVVIVGVGEDVEEVGQAVAWLGDEPVAIHDDSFSFTSDLNPEYVSHFMRSSLYRDQKREHVSRGKMKRLSAKSIGSVVIPVPPKDVQQRVVDVLNNFADLTSDLSSGLPAEIAARRQQYEYYRDRLLSFEELPE